MWPKIPINIVVIVFRMRGSVSMVRESTCEAHRLELNYEQNSKSCRKKKKKTQKIYNPLHLRDSRIRGNYPLNPGPLKNLYKHPRNHARDTRPRSHENESGIRRVQRC